MTGAGMARARGHGGCLQFMSALGAEPGFRRIGTTALWQTSSSLHAHWLQTWLFGVLSLALGAFHLVTTRLDKSMVQDPMLDDITVKRPNGR